MINLLQNRNYILNRKGMAACQRPSIQNSPWQLANAKAFAEVIKMPRQLNS